MTPSLKTECISNQPETPLTFGRLDGRNVVAEFNGGHISSEGGLLLIRQVDQQYGLSEQIAACFTDHRDPASVIVSATFGHLQYSSLELYTLKPCPI